MKLVKPRKLNLGDTIGVFTPSTPGYIHNEEMFLNGVNNLENLGFKVKLGNLTENRASDGYRSGSPKDRANEFMQLITDESVHAVMSTIGGMNSSSMIPYLDFKKIREKRKIVCGYSDITSLHMSILKYSGLKTLYGPGVMTWFGEWPDGIEESTKSFLEAATNTSNNHRLLTPFKKWSNHFRDWGNGDWKKIPREWKENSGWAVLNPGKASGEIIVANLNTLLSAAGTEYFPELTGKILLIEEMSAPWSLEERSLRQLDLMGVFNKIAGLIYGKIEMPDRQGAGFSISEMINEIVGSRDYPIISDFDCSHTVPMHTIGESCKVSINASNLQGIEFKILESFVE